MRWIALLLLIPIYGYSQNHLDFSTGYGVNKSLGLFFPSELRYNLEVNKGKRIWISPSVFWQWNTTAEYQIYPKIGITKGIVDKEKIKLNKLTLGVGVLDTKLIFNEFTRLKELDKLRLHPFMRMDIPFLPLYKLRKNSYRRDGWNMLFVVHLDMDGITYGIGLRPRLNRY